MAQALRSAGFGVVATGRRLTPKQALDDYRPADLADPAAVEGLVRGVRCVVHCAGRAHQFGPKAQDHRQFQVDNAEATSTVALAAAEAGVEHFVHISSVSVYGRQTGGPPDEEAECHPEGPYAESKYHAELKARQAAETRGMRLTVLRLATVYGEGDPGNVARLLRALHHGRFVWIGSGSNRKSLIHRDDVGRACVEVLRSQGSGVRVYNVSAPPCTMGEIVEAMAVALGRRPPRLRVPAALVLGLLRTLTVVSGERGPGRRLCGTLDKWLAEDVFDSSRIERELAFAAQTPLEEGIRREVEWFLRQGEC